MEKDNPFLFVQNVVFSCKVELEYEVRVQQFIGFFSIVQQTLFLVDVLFLLTFNSCFHINTFLSSAGSTLLKLI